MWEKVDHCLYKDTYSTLKQNYYNCVHTSHPTACKVKAVSPSDSGVPNGAEGRS